MTEQFLLNQKVRLKWEDIRLSHKASKRVILKGLTGEVHSGQFMTIMGPSGAGKSSFLQVLTARLRATSLGYDMEGRVSINGDQYTNSQFCKISAFAQQDNILLPTLTVQQTFMFQADLRLHNLSSHARLMKVEQMLKKLNLLECRHTMVGGQLKKSISGGQRKRVAIGVELITDPLILILDQPTSGLDSTTSASLTSLLKKLAEEDGKIIIATLHQPSSAMFQLFDQLLLIKEGQTIYLGQANRIVDYMQMIGVTVDFRMNPADFFMLEISEWKAQQHKHRSLMTSENYFKNRSQFMLPKSEEARQQIFGEKQAFNMFDHEITIAPPQKQVLPLMKRSLKNLLRAPSNQSGKLIALVLVPCLMSALYYGIGSRMPQFSQRQQLMDYLLQLGAFLFIGMFFTFGLNIYDAILVFPSEKYLVLKETQNNMYSIIIYFFMRLLIQLPGSIVPSLVSSIIVYIVVQLQLTAPHFMLFLLIMVMQGLIGSMTGIFLGIVFRTSELVVQLLPIIMIPLTIFGGLIVNLLQVQSYIQWMQYLSCVRHGYTAIMINQLSTQKMHHLNNNQQILQFIGVQGTVQAALAFHFAIYFALMIGSLLFLIFLKHKF